MVRQAGRGVAGRGSFRLGEAGKARRVRVGQGAAGSVWLARLGMVRQGRQG